MSNDDSFLHTETTNSFPQGEEAITIPVISEFVSVDKTKVETAKVNVKKKVIETTETINLSLQSEGYDIEHVPVNRYVDDEVPKARQEGDTLILPVVKEVIVKRTLLVEEVKITRKTIQTTAQQNIPVRAETVEVIRTPLVSEEQKK